MRSSRVSTVVAAFSMAASCLHVRARRPIYQTRPYALSRPRYCIRFIAAASMSSPAVAMGGARTL